ncbi:MAG: PepSY domain-containing protein [Comamonas sp.]
MQRTIHTTALAIALGLASMAGTAFASTADKLAATQAASMDLSQAIAAAQGQHGLKVVEAEIDLKKKQPVFEFKGINAQNHEQKLKLSGTNAAQVLESKDEGAAAKKYTDRLAAAKISINDAIATALKHTPGKAVEVDLDDHLGVFSYDVKIINAAGKEVEVRINAVDGTVKP